MDLHTYSYSGKVIYRKRHCLHHVPCVYTHMRCRELVRAFWRDEPACSNSGSKYVHISKTDNHPKSYSQPFQPASGPPSTSNIQSRDSQGTNSSFGCMQILPRFWQAVAGGNQLSDRIKLIHSCLIPRLSSFPAHPSG